MSKDFNEVVNFLNKWAKATDEVTPVLMPTGKIWVYGDTWEGIIKEAQLASQSYPMPTALSFEEQATVEYLEEIVMLGLDRFVANSYKSSVLQALINNLIGKINDNCK